MNPDEPERNREILVFKSKLDSPGFPGVQYEGYGIFVPCDFRFLSQTGSLRQYSARVTAANVIQIKMPAMPFTFVFDHQAIRNSRLCSDVRDAVIEQVAAFGDDTSTRYWKVINLVFPEGHKLSSKVVDIAGVETNEEGDRITEQWIQLDPTVTTTVSGVASMSSEYMVFKVARLDVPTI